jgi:hypothetical protein
LISITFINHSDLDNVEHHHHHHHHHHHAPNSVDQRMDFEGLFSGDMGELSNMDAVSQVNPIEEDTTDQSQWQQQDDLNLDDNTTTGGLSEETRTKLEECQNELDRLNNEKANRYAELAQMNNPTLRVNIYFKEFYLKKILFFLLECFIS